MHTAKQYAAWQTTVSRSVTHEGGAADSGGDMTDVQANEYTRTVEIVDEYVSE